MNWAKKHVLVVDDNKAVRAALCDALDVLGYQVFQASNGEDGLTLFEDDTAAVDVLVVDANMPGMTGWELLAEVRRQSRTVPVVISSGYVVSAEAIAADPYLFWLPKPYNLNDLQALMHQIFEKDDFAHR